VVAAVADEGDENAIAGVEPRDDATGAGAVFDVLGLAIVPVGGGRH
jgi:hypothetical protein